MTAALPEGAAATANEEGWTDSTVIQLLCGLIFDLCPDRDPVDVIEAYFVDAAEEGYNA